MQIVLTMLLLWSGEKRKRKGKGREGRLIQNGLEPAWRRYYRNYRTSSLILLVAYGDLIVFLLFLDLYQTAMFWCSSTEHCSSARMCMHELSLIHP